MKRLITVILCVLLVFSLASCTKVTKTYVKKASANNSSVSSSSEEKPTVSADSESSSQTAESSSESTVSENTSSQTSPEKEYADLTVDTVTKSAASFSGAYPDEKNYITYYVDSVAGNDNNDGKSKNAAWKSLSNVNATEFEPGTRVLLKRGSVFDQILSPISSGTEGKYFIIDAYGTGNKPQINGGGEASAVLLSNLSYIEVRNLEITNTKIYNDDGDAKCDGVTVKSGGAISPTELQEGGMVTHVYLINLDVHDVTCAECNRFYACIRFRSDMSKNPAGFSDVLVQGCTMQNTGGNGFTMASYYENGPGVDWTDGAYFPSQNICLRSNYVAHCASDGIFVSAVNNLLMEYNTVVDTCYSPGSYAGMWPHFTSNTVMQYNEFYDTKLVAGNGQGGDGQGMDVDINCDNTIVQYNYSHDNEGGFILLCTCEQNGRVGWNENITVRYNISQNDMGQIFTLSGPINDVKIYNNTVYARGDMPLRKGVNVQTNLVGSYDWGVGYSPSAVLFSNNIFYMDTTGNCSLQIPKRLTFRNNLFYGRYNYSNLEPMSTGSIFADPLFTNVGAAVTGQRDSAKCYALKAGSPAINAGLTLKESCKLDFFGNTVAADGKTDLGAIEYK